MKKIALIIACLLPAISFGQSMLFEIKPYIVNRVVVTDDTTFMSQTDTCTGLGLTVGGIGTDSAAVSYILYRNDGNVFETGIKNVPLQAVGIVISRPINLAAVNAVLSFWHIEATKQID